MTERAHQQLLIAARALGALVLQIDEVVHRAAVEDVVPAADVEDRDLDVFAVRRHGDTVPAHVIHRAGPGPSQRLLRDPLAAQPADGVLLLEHAARIAVGQPIRRRDHHIGGLQVRRRSHSRRIGGNPQRRAAGHADIAVAPGLGSRPFDGVVAILDVVLEGAVESLRTAFAAHILQHEHIARIGVALGLLGHLLARIGGLLRDPAVLEVGRATEDHRPGAASDGLIDIGRQLDAIAQGHHLFHSAGRQAGPLGDRRRRNPHRNPLGQGRRRRSKRQAGRGCGGEDDAAPGLGHLIASAGLRARRSRSVA